MTERQNEISRRLETVQQLEEVVTAMRGIAAARMHEADQSLAAVQEHASTLGEAIGEALALRGPADATPETGQGGGHLVILLTAEQGFVGSFCDAALDAAEAELDRAGGAPELMIAGSRGTALAEERDLGSIASAPMPLHVREVAGIASRITDDLFRRVAAGDIATITLLHARPGVRSGPQFRPATLIPFDYARFEATPRAIPPIVTLAPERLLAMLAEEYVFAEICEALTLAFVAENEARLHGMMAATENVKRKSEQLGLEFRQSRQEAITEEVLELAAGSLRR